MRALAFGLLAFLVTALAFVAAVSALVVPFVGPRVSHAVARLWARAILAAAGARLVVVGADRLAPREPRVLVSNHASYLDIPAMLAAFPGELRVVARRTLLWLPFVGAYMVLAGHFLVDRDDARQARRLFERIGKRMRRRGSSALLYPEGTRSLTGRLGPVKAGAFFLPLAARAPVQPVAVLGTQAILPKGAWGPKRGGVVEVRVGTAIPPTDGAADSVTRRALADRVRAAWLALGVPGDADGSAAADESA